MKIICRMLSVCSFAAASIVFIVALRSFIGHPPAQISVFVSTVIDVLKIQGIRAPLYVMTALLVTALLLILLGSVLWMKSNSKE